MDRELEYGKIQGMTYLVLKVENQMIGDLSSGQGYTNEEILSHLEVFIDLNNLLVNTLAQEIGTGGEKLYTSFAVTTPYLFRSAQESSTVDMTKFSKLMVQIDKKVYLKDVA